MQIMSDSLGEGEITQGKQSSNRRESRILPKPPGRGRNCRGCHWGKNFPFRCLNG